jgi:hypothetical protein
MIGTHFFTVSQNNVVAVNFQSIRVSSFSTHSSHAEGLREEKKLSSFASGTWLKKVEISSGDA